MFDTRVTRRLGLAAPVANAGMAMVARPALAAAVSDAGGLGTIGCDIEGPDALRAMVRETARRTDHPFGVDLIGDFATDAHVDVLVDERVAVAIFFWRLPSPAQVARLHGAGAEVWMQVGSVAEADAAVETGVDALIVQGAEAGGHNRSEASIFTLFPRLRRRYPALAMLWAGGVVDGATMAAALMLGADAVWCGTRFLASREASAHSGYKAAVLAADVGDTAITRIYGPEWPDQPVRAIVNPGLERVRQGGQVAIDDVPMGHATVGGARVPLPRYSAILPTPDFEGNLDFACLTAGQGAGNIDAIVGAADIVAALMREAAERFALCGTPRFEDACGR